MMIRSLGIGITAILLLRIPQSCVVSCLALILNHFLRCCYVFTLKTVVVSLSIRAAGVKKFENFMNDVYTYLYVKNILFQMTNE